ncbi:MAG: polyphosphate kinase 2, partial [Campylobacterales bacterium]
KDKGKRLLVIFEGIDTAGKGGTIKRITEHLNPRGLRVVALSKPSDIEKTQWYFQRYSSHLPSGGEIVLFDRSWYNRAGVERVMGFCTNEEYQKFFRQVTSFEEMLVDDGIMFFKYYLTITKEEQSARIAARKTDPLKMWKLSPVDLAAHEHYDDYKEAEKEMFIRTHTPYAPWIIVDANDKRKARLNIIRDLLIHIDYDEKDRDAIGATDPHIIRLYSHLTYK